MTNEETFKEVIQQILAELPENELVTDAIVTKGFIEATVGEELDYSKVIAENKELTANHKALVRAYGFETFYDLYLYADSCDSINHQLQKGGNKQFSKLKRVTRTVVRNGKPMKTTIYTDGKGEDSDKNPLDKGTTPNSSGKQPRHAKDMAMVFIGNDDTGANPKQVAQLAKEAEALGGQFDTDCNSYMILQGELGDLGGCAGFKKEGNYLHLAFFQADDVTTGVAFRAFYQLLLRAWRAGLGAMVDDFEDETARELFKEYGLTKSGNRYKISATKLKRALGDR